MHAGLACCDHDQGRTQQSCGRARSPKYYQYMTIMKPVAGKHSIVLTVGLIPLKIQFLSPIFLSPLYITASLGLTAFPPLTTPAATAGAAPPATPGAAKACPLACAAVGSVANG